MITKLVRIKDSGEERRIQAATFDRSLHLALGPPELNTTPDAETPSRKAKKRRRKVSA